MSNNQFRTFQKFSDKRDAQLLKERLEKGNIESILEDVSPSLDITFAGNNHEDQFLLKLRQNDFARANEILEAQAKEVVDQFSSDHYLFEFTDDELLEVIEKSDEWSKEDYLLAIKILNERGHGLDEAKIEEIKTKRLNELRKPAKGKTVWLIMGYFFALVGGLIGMLIGWSHWKATKIDPTGKRFYVYDESTRKAGRTIFLIGVFVFVLSAVFAFMNK